MALKILSPGLEQYGPGGQAHIKALIIGGPGSGKTRWSSFFPKPFYMDIEAGLSSIADRGELIAAARVSNSDDMLEVIKYMEQECRKPILERRYTTLVVDTVDAFQRKVKDEWLRKNPNVDSFRGYDAWGYLDAKMQLLLTRLLNLDMNIIVTVHYESKQVTEGVGDTAEQRTVVQLQLSGSVKETIFNDFDLVGWMGTFFKQEGGQRVQKRGLTFRPTFERPFLKDRLNVTPEWMEVTFSDEDYALLFGRIAERLDHLPDSRELGEIETQQDEAAGGVLLEGGALPEVSPKDVPLEQFDKPTLQGMCRKLKIEIKSNNIKSELVQFIRGKRAELAAAGIADPTIPGSEGKPFDQLDAPATEAAAADAATPAATETADTSAAPAAPAEAPAAQEPPAPAAPEVPAAESPAAPPAPAVPEAPATPAPAPSAPAEPAAAPAPVAEQPPVVNGPVTPEGTVQTEAGVVDANGEIKAPAAEPTHDEALAAVTGALPSEVISDKREDEAPSTVASAPAAPPAASAPPVQRAQAKGPTGTCEKEGCDVQLDAPGENPDLVKLSFIKFRKKFCNVHYQEERAKAS